MMYRPHTGVLVNLSILASPAILSFAMNGILGRVWKEIADGLIFNHGTTATIFISWYRATELRQVNIARKWWVINNALNVLVYVLESWEFA